MARLIDADAAIKEITELSENPFVMTDKQIKFFLAKQPAIDHITRCKDCHKRIDVSGTRYCTFWERNTEDDWYCSQGY